MQGWGGSYRGGVDHTGVGGSYMGGVSHKGVGWVMQGRSGSCRGGVGHAGVGVRWVIQRQDGVGHKKYKILKILNCWCYRVSNPANQTQICRVLNFLNHDK